MLKSKHKADDDEHERYQYSWRRDINNNSANIVINNNKKRYMFL